MIKNFDDDFSIQMIQPFDVDFVIFDLMWFYMGDDILC